ncbi:hypothetical protein N7519_008029 [Penicillium mononematosum]|uniref:uncharacterized protein n=1 Tax=Penicillium mononematosum TaxID=268346 RepID=UPI0025470B6D|nr:uncharacterized protein N7519_008029 [Penicillium mononematosum]KAJ6186728.1 hypothetical protein N7519_008029 [Penicillium mononematosum]
MNRSPNTTEIMDSITTHDLRPGAARDIAHLPINKLVINGEEVTASDRRRTDGAICVGSPRGLLEPACAIPCPSRHTRSNHCTNPIQVTKASTRGADRLYADFMLQNLRSAGFIGIETIDCGPDEDAQTFCCPIASALEPWPRTSSPLLLLLSSNMTGGWYVPIRNE